MKRAMKCRAFALSLAMTAALASLAYALPKINVTEDGLAVKGYDVVAYFTLARPVKGLAEFEHSWQGARWRFSSRAHLELFVSDPEKYAPRYGGY